MKKFNITFRFFWKDVIHKFSNIEYSVGRGGGRLDKKRNLYYLRGGGCLFFIYLLMPSLLELILCKRNVNLLLDLLFSTKSNGKKLIRLYGEKRKITHLYQKDEERPMKKKSTC